MSWLSSPCHCHHHCLCHRVRAKWGSIEQQKEKDFRAKQPISVSCLARNRWNPQMEWSGEFNKETTVFTKSRTSCRERKGLAYYLPHPSYRGKEKLLMTSPRPDIFSNRRKQLQELGGRQSCGKSHPQELWPLVKGGSLAHLQQGRLGE